MTELIAPTTRLHRAWLESRDEWGRGVHQDGAGFRSGDEYDSAEGFATWVARLRAEEDVTVPPAPNWVHCTYRWIVEDGRVLGAIALRHELNEMLFTIGGHIGYGVRPSARRRGLASWALAEILDEARKLGLDRVLITCDVGNTGSARTILKAGGVLEDVREGKQRYWIAISG
ncbi:putative acetyltransferase [Actinoplanes tereljensis]|uniref:Acetyltransferase n=1 Tax=Paractinoplanes tereljensis TaxID=571912 RepID=A0A919NXZ4_9ACTN|nr:GNAT family N-acetyltransferase [Actinoplanes tereljensis]GIF25904.1 acetyltransferase [Actinoplanes tereljensis]